MRTVPGQTKNLVLLPQIMFVYWLHLNLVAYHISVILKYWYTFSNISDGKSRGTVSSRDSLETVFSLSRSWSWSWGLVPWSWSRSWWSMSWSWSRSYCLVLSRKTTPIRPFVFWPFSHRTLTPDCHDSRVNFATGVVYHENSNTLYRQHSYAPKPGRTHLFVSLAINAFRTLEVDSYLDANPSPWLHLCLRNRIVFLLISKAIGPNGILDASHTCLLLA